MVGNSNSVGVPSSSPLQNWNLFVMKTSMVARQEEETFRNKKREIKKRMGKEDIRNKIVCVWVTCISREVKKRNFRTMSKRSIQLKMKKRKKKRKKVEYLKRSKRKYLNLNKQKVLFASFYNKQMNHVLL